MWHQHPATTDSVKPNFIGAFTAGFNHFSSSQQVFEIDQPGRGATSMPVLLEQLMFILESLKSVRSHPIRGTRRQRRIWSRAHSFIGRIVIFTGECFAYFQNVDGQKA
jgi:hypothetical protein